MRPAHESRLYIVTTFLIGWAHTLTDPCSIGHVYQYLMKNAPHISWLLLAKPKQGMVSMG